MHRRHMDCLKSTRNRNTNDKTTQSILTMEVPTPMRINGFDHIAIATTDLPAAIAKFESILNAKASEIVHVPDQEVMSAVFALGNASIELMQPTNPEGGIQKFIEKKGEGIHHIALKVDDIDKAEKEYSIEHIKLIIGTANGNKSVFIHPKSTGGVLIELCEHRE